MVQIKSEDEGGFAAGFAASGTRNDNTPQIAIRDLRFAICDSRYAIRDTERGELHFL